MTGWLGSLQAARSLFRWLNGAIFISRTINIPTRQMILTAPSMPAIRWPKQFLGLLVRDACGLNVISTLKYFIDIPLLTSAFNRRFLGEAREAHYRQAADMWVFYLLWSVVGIGGLWLFGSRAAVLFLLYWLVPYCTWTQVFFRIRGAIEHGNVPDPHNPYQQTRTYFIPAWLGFFFAPKHVNYHLEHHLYPSIPFYNLPRMHAVLKRAVYLRESAYCEPFGVSLQKLAEG